MKSIWEMLAVSVWILWEAVTELGLGLQEVY